MPILKRTENQSKVYLVRGTLEHLYRVWCDSLLFGGGIKVLFCIFATRAPNIFMSLTHSVAHTHSHYHNVYKQAICLFTTHIHTPTNNALYIYTGSDWAFCWALYRNRTGEIFEWKGPTRYWSREENAFIFNKYWLWFLFLWLLWYGTYASGKVQFLHIHKSWSRYNFQADKKSFLGRQTTLSCFSFSHVSRFLIHFL